MSDVIDRIMERKSAHVSYLKDLFAAMQAKGFDNIRINDEDLEPYSVEKDGAEAVIREMFQLDDMVKLKADWPRHSGDIPPYDEPYRVVLFFILCNEAHEALADHTIPCEGVDEVLSEIVNELGEKYE